MKIALIFNKEREDTIGIYFVRALNELGYEFDHYWTKDAYGIEPKYDLFLRIDHGDYKYDMPHNLHPSAFYAIDTNLTHSHKKIKEQAKHYDFVFCVERDAAEAFKRDGINAFWLPLACDPSIHSKIDVEKRYDLGFIGTDGGVPRKFILQELRERFPNSFIGPAAFTEIAQGYSQAKIGFQFIQPQTKHTVPMSMRFFEIMSCGTMLLANKIPDENLAALDYKDRKHLVIYKDLKEMFSLIEYYLKHDDERVEIAERGYRLTIEKHAYTNRVKEIIDVVKGVRG